MKKREVDEIVWEYGNPMVGTNILSGKLTLFFPFSAQIENSPESINLQTSEESMPGIRNELPLVEKDILPTIQSYLYTTQLSPENTDVVQQVKVVKGKNIVIPFSKEILNQIREKIITIFSSLNECAFLGEKEQCHKKKLVAKEATLNLF